MYAVELIIAGRISDDKCLRWTVVRGWTRLGWTCELGLLVSPPTHPHCRDDTDATCPDIRLVLVRAGVGDELHQAHQTIDSRTNRRVPFSLASTAVWNATGIGSQKGCTTVSWPSRHKSRLSTPFLSLSQFLVSLDCSPPSSPNSHLVSLSTRTTKSSSAHTR